MAKATVFVHHPEWTPPGRADGPVSEEHFKHNLEPKGFKRGPAPEKKGTK